VYIAFDGLHILHIFLLGIGVIETQVACATEFLGCPEVHDKSLGVAYVQVAVGLRRETGVEASAVFAGLQVILYDLLHKVEAFALGSQNVILNFFHNRGKCL
jgi:hypothetical protein